MINFALFKKEIRENRTKFIIFFLLFSILGGSLPFFHNLIKDIFRGMGMLINMEILINLSSELEFILDSYDNYLWSQWTAKNLMQFTVVAAIVLGMSPLAGEAAYGTAVFLLSKPIKRQKIFTSKIAAGIFLLATCVFGSTFVLILSSILKGFSINISALLISVAITFAGGVVIYVGTIIFSALFTDSIKAGVAATLFWVVASVPGYFRATASFSIFRQMSAVDYWIYGENPTILLLTLLLVACLFYLGGYFIWKQREF